MIKAEERQLLHKYLLTDLAVKSLQIDYQKAEKFKMKVVFLPLIDTLIMDLRKKSACTTKNKGGRVANYR